MKFTTQSDCPVTADFHGEGVVLSYLHDSYDANLNKKVITERITLTSDELEQIYNAFKEFMGETE